MPTLVLIMHVLQNKLNSAFFENPYIFQLLKDVFNEIRDRIQILHVNPCVQE